MTYRRYGVYYAPQSGSDLACFGASWLGWDAEAGAEALHPDAPIDVAAITATPRRYGFHGTLKPPFVVNCDIAMLMDGVEMVAASHAPFQTPPIQLSRLGSFFALTLSAPSEDLKALAAACVTGLDAFRTPPTNAELAKRRANRLTEAQDALLIRWGYPYVLEEFRFHLTLTGALNEADAKAAEATLAAITAPLLAPLEIAELTLFGEAEDGRFHIVRRFSLTG